MKKLFIIIMLLLVLSNVLACSPPKKTTDKIRLIVDYNSSYTSFSNILINKNKYYVNGGRLIQNQDYELISIYPNKTINCIKKIKSYPSMMYYCDNSFCGYLEKCFTLTSKQQKILNNSKFMLVPVEDIDCNKNKFINYNPKKYLK